MYPASAEAAGIEGFVMVGYDVSDTGEVINVSVIDAQPPGVFDAAAIAAVAQWRFNAAVRHGVTVAATGRSSRIEFKLGDNEAHVR
ncbi:MAG: TonB family protein [Gammaproteobacteria bacterium]|nr:TonB family protein [Gammaproteobacteria bacterium]